MTTKITSRLIPDEYLKHISSQDMVLLMRDLLCFDQLCYEVITDKGNKILEIKYHPVVVMRA